MHNEWFAFRAPRAICSIDDGGAAVIAGGDTSVAVADAPAADTSVTDPGTSDTDTSDVALDTKTDTDAEKPDVEVELSDEPGEDGVSPKDKARIDELKKTDPAAAKKLKAQVYGDAAFRKEFPGGFKEAQALKNTIQELAGEEGIDGLRESVQAWRSIDDRFAAGDPSVLKDFAAFNKESFDKIVPPAITQLAESNPAVYGECMPGAMDKLSSAAPEVYQQYMSGVVTATLDNYKISDTITNLVRSLGTIKDSDGNAVAGDEIAQLQQILKTVDGFRELAKKAPAQKVDVKADPAKSEYEAKLAGLKQQENQAIVKQVGDAIQSYATGKYTDLVAAELKSNGSNLSKDGQAYKSLIADIDGRIGQEINADTKFKDKYNALVQAGKSQDAIKLANSRFDQVVFKTVRSVVSLWSKDIKGTTAKPDAKGAAQPAAAKAGVVTVKQRPDSSAVDWSRTDRQKYMFHGEFYKPGDNRMYKLVE